MKHTVKVRIRNMQGTDCQSFTVTFEENEVFAAIIESMPFSQTQSMSYETIRKVAAHQYVMENMLMAGRSVSSTFSTRVELIS